MNVESGGLQGSFPDSSTEKYLVNGLNDGGEDLWGLSKTWSSAFCEEDRLMQDSIRLSDKDASGKKSIFNFCKSKSISNALE